MAFKVRCPKCQKVYAAEPQWVGKRIRCKACGEGFVVEQPAEDPSVQAASAFGTSNAPPPRSSESISGRSATRIAPSPAENSEDPADPFAVRQDEYPILRPSVPQDFPMATVIEAWLPLALGLISVVLCASQIISQNGTGRTWISVLRFAIVAALYFLLIVPVTYKVVTVRLKKLRRTLPPNPMSRIAATFALPAAFAVVFWQGIGGIGGITIGVILGLVLMTAVFWLLFRLTPEEAANAYGWAAGTFMVATTVAALFIIGASAGVNHAMITAHATEYRESPLGAQLAWTSPEPAPTRKPPTDAAPPVANTAVADTPPPSTPDKIPSKPAPRATVADQPVSAVANANTTPTSESVPVNSPPVAAITNAATTPPVPDSAPLFANPDDDQFVVNLRKKSVPWIKQVSRANTQGPFDFIISSSSATPYIGMVTLDPNSIAERRFSVGYIMDSGMRRTPTLEISDLAGTPRSFSRDYFLTPDGKALLHMQGYEVHIMHIGQPVPDSFATIPPARQTGASVVPQIVGLARDNTVVVRWSGPGSSEQFIQRYSYVTHKPLEAGGMQNCSIASDVTAVSNNTEGLIWFASLITPDGRRPSICLYNATSSGGGGGKSMPLPGNLNDISHYDAELAFSPNAAKIVLMLADADNTSIYEWVTANLGAPSLHVSLPPLPASVTTGHVVGPRVRWIDDFDFIVDGQTVIGTYPNRAGIIGTVSDTPVLAAANTTKNHMLVTYAAEDGFCHAADIEFDPAALKTAMPIKDTPAAH